MLQDTIHDLIFVTPRVHFCCCDKTRSVSLTLLFSLYQVMYENKSRLLCTAEGSPQELFENIVTVSDAKQMAPRTSSRSIRSDDSDLCVDNELGFAKDRTISRYKCYLWQGNFFLRTYLHDCFHWIPHTKCWLMHIPSHCPRNHHYVNMFVHWW